tara:strand:+ start:21 stop:146 length:126 start_codon:yes stop_codon:yes gene_type:complete
LSLPHGDVDGRSRLLPLNLSCNPLLILMNVLGEAKNAAEEK